jgi:hypothetical protein
LNHTPRIEIGEGLDVIGMVDAISGIEINPARLVFITAFFSFRFPPMRLYASSIKGVLDVTVNAPQR